MRFPSRTRRSFAVPCELSAIHLQAYLDGELDAAGAADFEHHMQSCAQCTAALASENALRQTLAASLLYERAPAGLRQRVLSSLPAPSPTPAMKFPIWR